MSNFQKFYGVRPSSTFSTGEIRKPIGETTKSTVDDIKIQRGELTKIWHWLKNVYTWFTHKQRNGWLTFKCQKILRKIALAIKLSLMVEKGTQYMNHLKNNAVKNQIYSKKSQYIYLDWLFDIMYETNVSLSPRLIYLLWYVIRWEQICKTFNISWRLVSLHITGD